MKPAFFIPSIISGILLCAASAVAQKTSSPALSKDQPIEISADSLDVRQEEHQAVFSGNVIARQGATNLRAKTMTVHYSQGSESKPAAGVAAQGITKIEAVGGVVFSTPSETAQGDTAIYNAAADTIELTGGNVLLTREQNILKGQRLTYNLATGRSVLTAGGAVVNEQGKRVGGRVQGLFVPKPDKP